MGASAPFAVYDGIVSYSKLYSVKFAIIVQGTAVPTTLLLITLSPAFVFDKQHTVLARDTAPRGDNKAPAGGNKGLGIRH